MASGREGEASSPFGDFSWRTSLAAHALSPGATMVTNNGREFSRVSGLVVENWMGVSLA